MEIEPQSPEALQPQASSSETEVEPNRPPSAGEGTPGCSPPSAACPPAAGTPEDNQPSTSATENQGPGDPQLAAGESQDPASPSARAAPPASPGAARPASGAFRENDTPTSPWDDSGSNGGEDDDEVVERDRAGLDGATSGQGRGAGQALVHTKAHAVLGEGTWAPADGAGVDTRSRHPGEPPSDDVETFMAGYDGPEGGAMEVIARRMKAASNPCDLELRDFPDPHPVFGFVSPMRMHLFMDFPRMQLSGGDALVSDGQTEEPMFKITGKAFATGLRRSMTDVEGNPILVMSNAPGRPRLSAVTEVRIGAGGSLIATIEGKPFDTARSAFAVRLLGRDEALSAAVHLGTAKTYFTVLYPGDPTHAIVQVRLMLPSESGYRPGRYHMRLAAGADAALAAALVSQFHAHVALRQSSLAMFMR